MAIRDIESFETTAWQVNGKWSGLLDEQAVAAHDGALGVRTNGGGDTYLFGSSEQIAWVGFWYQNDPVGAMLTDAFIRIADGATRHVTVGQTSTGEVRVWRGTETGTVLGTSAASGLIAKNVWAFIEVGFKIDDATGWVEVRVNGITAISLSGIDTRNGANASADRVTICGNDGVSTAFFDSFYFVDNTGTPTGFLGVGAAVDLHPNGAGTSTQWTPLSGANYTNVDDPAAHDSDTTYNSSTTAGHKDMFALENVAVTGGSIAAVKLVTFARDTVGGGRQIADVINLGGGESQRATRTTSSAYAVREELFTVDPADASVLTEAKINAAEIGYVLIS